MGDQKVAESWVGLGIEAKWHVLDFKQEFKLGEEKR